MMLHPRSSFERIRNLAKPLEVAKMLRANLPHGVGEAYKEGGLGAVAQAYGDFIEDLLLWTPRPTVGVLKAAALLEYGTKHSLSDEQAYLFASSVYNLILKCRKMSRVVTTGKRTEESVFRIINLIRKHERSPLNQKLWEKTRKLQRRRSEEAPQGEGPSKKLARTTVKEQQEGDEVHDEVPMEGSAAMNEKEEEPSEEQEESTEPSEEEEESEEATQEYREKDAKHVLPVQQASSSSTDPAPKVNLPSFFRFGDFSPMQTKPKLRTKIDETVNVESSPEMATILAAVQARKNKSQAKMPAPRKGKAQQEQWFDWAKMTMVRKTPGTCHEAKSKMIAGPDGFAVAIFADGQQIITECSNELLAAYQKQAAVHKKPARKSEAEASQVGEVPKEKAEETKAIPSSAEVPMRNVRLTNAKKPERTYMTGCQCISGPHRKQLIAEWTLKQYGPDHRAKAEAALAYVQEKQLSYAAARQIKSCLP